MDEAAFIGNWNTQTDCPDLINIYQQTFVVVFRVINIGLCPKIVHSNLHKIVMTYKLQMTILFPRMKRAFPAEQDEQFLLRLA